MGSSVRRVTASRLPVANHLNSSSWEVMDRPVRIGTNHSDGPEVSRAQLQQGQNRAQYVTTQPNPGDVMATIASEFERYAAEASSHRNSVGSMSQNSISGRNSDLNHNVSPGRSDTTRNQSQGQGLQPSPRRSHVSGPQGSPGRRSMGTRYASDSALSDHVTTLDRVAQHRSDSQRSDPTEDRQGSNPIRHTRTSQLRNTMASQNREGPTTSYPEPMGYLDIHHQSTVSGGYTDGAGRRTHRLEPPRAQETASTRFFENFRQDASPASQSVMRYENELHEKKLLDLMTRGFRTFTVEMADVIIDRLKPENENLARLVGREVKDVTEKEIIQLRGELKKADAKIKTLEKENTTIKENFDKERNESKKEAEKEVMKRAKMFQDQSNIITKLESDVQTLQETLKDKEKRWRKAELRAKAEENKRQKLEDDFGSKVKAMEKQLDKVKGDLLVEKSVRRIKTMSSTGSGSRASSGRLVSHHGTYKRDMIQPKHVPYDEGDE